MNTLDDATRQAVSEFRRTAASLGYDLSDLTDEEVVAGVRRVVKAVRSFGISVAEAVRGFSVLTAAREKEEGG